MKKDLISILKENLNISEAVGINAWPLSTLQLYSCRKIFMSKRCNAGISPLKGHNVSHAKNKTKRRFLPNLKKLLSSDIKKNIKLNVATLP